jgi:hypothetical protein
MPIVRSDMTACVTARTSVSECLRPHISLTPEAVAHAVPGFEPLGTDYEVNSVLGVVPPELYPDLNAFRFCNVTMVLPTSIWEAGSFTSNTLITEDDGAGFTLRPRHFAPSAPSTPGKVAASHTADTSPRPLHLVAAPQQLAGELLPKETLAGGR